MSESATHEREESTSSSEQTVVTGNPDGEGEPSDVDPGGNPNDSGGQVNEVSRAENAVIGAVGGSAVGYAIAGPVGGVVGGAIGAALSGRSAEGNPSDN